MGVFERTTKRSEKSARPPTSSRLWRRPRAKRYKTTVLFEERRRAAPLQQRPAVFQSRVSCCCSTP